jgi:integrase
MSTPMSNGVARLSALPASELRKGWRSHFGEEPPHYGRRLLAARLAYRLQASTHGGLSPATEEAVRALVTRAGAGDPSPARQSPVTRPVEGATLVRQWRSVRHAVHVTADGFIYQGHTYDSLTAVARAITGVHRSGPAFFGLLAAPRDDGPGPTGRAHDLALTVARAYHWCGLLEEGGRSPRELAHTVGITVPGLTRHLHAAVLAPDIVHAIVTGPSLRRLPLRKLIRLPLDWPSQRKEAVRLGLRPASSSGDQSFAADPSLLAVPGHVTRARSEESACALPSTHDRLSVRAQLEGIVELHAVARDLRPGTVTFYRAQIPVLERFCREHAIEQMQDWTQDHGLAFVTWLSARPCALRGRRWDDQAPRFWSARRVNMVLGLARLAFGRLLEAGQVEADPLRGVRDRREDRNTVPVYLSDEEAKALLTACDLRRGIGCRDYLILAFCLCLGLRPSEVCRVRRCDLQGSRLTVPAAATKVRTTHRLLLPEDPQRPGELDPELGRPLKVYLAWRGGRSTAVADHGPLFVNVTGRPLTPHALHEMCRGLATRAGLGRRQVTIYVCRHTCAVRALKQSNWDIEFVRRLLRHRDIAMTQRYLRLLDKDFEDRARRVDMLSGISLPAGLDGG